ncbi:ethylene-responsive transcription factor [Canna indica]|uniref:Ethylene-responsive transcription factor n=1 Tax=Canna indica TaxID=4628 RepID=A0AAQ3KF51_9LILI|nr:ethylene-responsive transcription factor [Canna indica]
MGPTSLYLSPSSSSSCCYLISISNQKQPTTVASLRRKPQNHWPCRCSSLRRCRRCLRRPPQCCSDRSGKRVSEIQEPRKTWMGMYPTTEMIVMTYDVAAHVLRGADVVLNFPDEIASCPVPASASPTNIHVAAAFTAALLMLVAKEGDDGDAQQ